MILAGVFSLFALLTTFWSNTLALRDVVHEQIGSGNRISWLIATVPLYSVCRVWREQLYRSDPDHEWRCGAGEHHAGADLWKVQEKSRQQSYLRRDRHGTVSGADGTVYAAVCNRCIDPVELISRKPQIQ